MCSICIQKHIIGVSPTPAVPFLFDGKSAKWLSDLLRDSIRSWDDLTEVLYTRISPSSKIMTLKYNIDVFKNIAC